MDIDRKGALSEIKAMARAYDQAQVTAENIRLTLADACKIAHGVGVRDREMAEATLEVMRKGLTRGRIQQLRNLGEVNEPAGV